MKKVNLIKDLVWLVNNKKALDFECWCAEYDLNSGNPYSLRFYINEQLKKQKQEKMSNSFSTSAFFQDGYKVQWVDETCNLNIIFNKCKEHIDFLYSKLKTKVSSVIKFKVVDGKEIKIA